ncbi:hypothetical protein TruAng_002772 [Truncatella angustata]|nr:hypothetical protein TruAng_002772 [Truncatella angustata]
MMIPDGRRHYASGKCWRGNAPILAQSCAATLRYAMAQHSLGLSQSDQFELTARCTADETNGKYLPGHSYGAWQDQDQDQDQDRRTWIQMWVCAASDPFCGSTLDILLGPARRASTGAAAAAASASASAWFVCLTEQKLRTPCVTAFDMTCSNTKPSQLDLTHFSLVNSPGEP